MWDKILSSKLYSFLELIRFYQPIGYMLLTWPCWFALTLTKLNYIDVLPWYILFLTGSFLMRSAGCIINDLIDINIDRNIYRTKNRPLASNKISIKESLIFLFFLLILSFIILLQFNFIAIMIGLISFPFIILYPFMKRFTYWTQLFLGIVFNWGVIIVSFQFVGSFNINYLLLYFACIFWTLAYDTIYAYQDKNDDIKNSIKSTAVLFKNNGLKWIKFFYLIFFVLIGYISWKSSNNFYSFIVIILAIFAMNNFLNKWKPESINSSNYYFKFNNIIGLLCFIFLLFNS